jgi:hypothetical protein
VEKVSLLLGNTEGDAQEAQLDHVILAKSEHSQSHSTVHHHNGFRTSSIDFGIDKCNQKRWIIANQVRCIGTVR